MVNNTTKAFIFSIDAFIAFTLSLIAIYSLIFFSSMPSAQYAVLTQAHYLAKDSLSTLMLTKCDALICGVGNTDASIVDYVAFRTGGTPHNPDQIAVINAYLNDIIPPQYGYKIELGNGVSWDVIYDSAVDDATNKHIKSMKRLSVSSYAVIFNVNSGNPQNQYKYMTCNGNPELVPCDFPPEAIGGSQPSSQTKVVKFTIYA